MHFKYLENITNIVAFKYKSIFECRVNVVPRKEFISPKYFILNFEEIAFVID